MSAVRTPQNDRYAWYVVAVLMLANVSSYVDRQILALLVEPIKNDLQLSDTQMSYLYGLTFALFFTIMGLPIARMADHRSRRNIIAWGVAIWSVMTAACGVARTFGQLALARVGVGVGEAALGPPALSLLADYFSKGKLGRAVSVYGIGIYLGSGLAYFIGGQVIEYAASIPQLTVPVLGSIRSWQLVFLLVGAPGLLIAALMLTIREPIRRVRTDAPLVSDRAILSWISVHKRTFTALMVGFGFYSMVNFGTAAWLPSFLTRVHGWAPGKIGLYMGGATMTFGVLGIYAGGWLADRWMAKGRADAKLLVGIVGSMGAMLSAIPLYLTSSDRMVIALLVPLNIFSAFPFGAAQAALQEVSPSAMRARITALYLFANTLIGFSLGPFVVAFLTDYVFRNERFVGYSILVVAVLGHMTASTLLARGRRSYGNTARAADQADSVSL